MADKPKYLSKEGLLFFWTAIKNILSEKVDKENGKGLSSNDYSTEEKNKLNNIEAGAQVNIIQSIKVNDQTQSINQKNVNITVPLVDSSLKNIGQSADAKATGDAIAEMSTQFTQTATAIRQEFNNADNQLAQEMTQAFEELSDTIPTKTSDLTNDSNYVNTMELTNGLAAKEDALQYGTAIAEDIGKAMMPKTVTNGKVTEWEFGEAGKVNDVQVNGTSVLKNKVANIPIAGVDKLGVILANPIYGISVSGFNGDTYINRADLKLIKKGSDIYRPIVPYNQHESTFYALAKAAGDITQASSSNVVGTYTDQAKAAIQSMLGIDTAIADAVSDITSFEFQVVTELPATGTKGVIYLVAHTHDTNDAYDEYIWITDRYERLGTLDVDLSNYVTFDDIANANKAGVIKVAPTYGIRTENGILRIDEAVSVHIKQGTDPDHPIVSKNQHEATFYGLAKASGDTTQSQSSNTVGQYTAEAKSAIQSMLGVPSENDVVTDVQVNGTSIVTDGVAEIPIADSNTMGIVKVSNVNQTGLQFVNGELQIFPANPSDIKSAWGTYRVLTPPNQHAATFYGLAKAAGDTTQSASANAVGQYTDEAKSAIQSMLGVPSKNDVVTDVQVNGTSVVTDGVAEIPVASTNSKLGLVRTNLLYGIAAFGNGFIGINKADQNQEKLGVENNRPIVPSNQHISTFYGLAKAAGDTTQSASDNPVGTYTEEAKVAIRNMIDATGESASVTITGTDPVIQASRNTRYICGEILSLDFTPCASGICEVIFTSGSSVTVLTLPETIKMPEWFEVETNHTYEISVVDGVYGAVMVW